MSLPRVAIAGLGGFAANHHAVIEALENQGLCRLTRTCDPSLESHAGAIDKFNLKQRGVQLDDSFESMMDHAQEFDVVLLPTPIPLHADQHRRVIKAGKACYLEKPPTLFWPEFQEMLRVEQGAKWQTQIGFNFVGDPFRRTIKERIRSGEFGPLQGATLLALWPRDLAYYRRNNWAGKLKVDGKPVMDSPIGNACAHFVQDLLWWCGLGDVDSVAKVRQVQAKLFHAHPIESFDTVFLDAKLDGGQWLKVAATHTGLGDHTDQETIYCEHAKITLNAWHSARIEFADDRTEVFESPLKTGSGPLGYNIRTYLNYVSGSLSRPGTTLEESASFVRLHHMAFESAGGVAKLDESRLTNKDGKIGVAGLEDELRKFALP